MSNFRVTYTTQFRICCDMCAQLLLLQLFVVLLSLSLHNSIRQRCHPLPVCQLHRPRFPSPVCPLLPLWVMQIFVCLSVGFWLLLCLALGTSSKAVTPHPFFWDPTPRTYCAACPPSWATVCNYLATQQAKCRQISGHIIDASLSLRELERERERDVV